jgi:hypothetical protein
MMYEDFVRFVKLSSCESECLLWAHFGEAVAEGWLAAVTTANEAKRRLPIGDHLMLDTVPR